MLENWLSSRKNSEQVPKDSFGGRIRLFGDGEQTIEAGSLALLGIPGPASGSIRRELYALGVLPEGAPIIDLGDARKEEPDFIIPLLQELFESKVCTLLFGARARHLPAQFQAQQNLQRPVSLSVIDERASGLEWALKKPHPDLFHFSLLGLQSHLSTPSDFSALEDRHFEALRLGALRSDITQAEPYLRDADLVGFHLAAVRQSESPGAGRATPSGLFSEEACQLARYAGMSDKIRGFGIYGYRPDLDRRRQTAQLCAHLIWYFAEGFLNRKQDFPMSADGLLEYIVEYKDLDMHLTFWKSSKSGRWWLQAPEPPSRDLVRHRLIPCSYGDYAQAARGELPARLLNALKRFL